VPPDYQDACKREGIQGTVHLCAIIENDGTVQGIAVLDGDSRLAQSAECAVCLSHVEQRGQAQICNPAAMLKSKGKIPEFLRTSPMSLLCPTCMSMPGRDCITNSAGLAAIHVARIKAGALADKQKESE
jgi:hypothetical protein